VKKWEGGKERKKEKEKEREKEKPGTMKTRKDGEGKKKHYEK
jgi:hypothetical protein